MMPCQCAQVQKLISEWLGRDFSPCKPLKLAASLLGLSTGSSLIQTAISPVQQDPFKEVHCKGELWLQGQGLQYHTAAPPDHRGPSPVLLPPA